MVRETRHLWVGNLPESVREDRIREHFKRSTEDVSPPNFEQRSNSYYDRSSRLAPEPDQYIRRPNNYHASDVRGRARDRLYRNGPYSSMTDRTTTVGHHRVSNWYDSSPSGTSTLPGQSQSPSTRSVYGNVASAVVQPDTSSYDCQLLKKKKSRSGSESPCGASNSVNATSSHSSHIVDRGNGGSAASSRSHSRSPSSCSSTNSTSSNSHASSPVSGSDPPLSSSSTRTRNLQSAVSAPIQSSMTISNQIISGNAGSSSSSSTGNPVVHSEDNRPLAICVRNLPARSSDTSLKDGLFHEYKKHGKVTWVKVVGQNAERYALVCFKKPDDVEKALEVSHDKLFFGCKIEVAPYQGYDVEDNEFRPYEAELDEYHPKSTRTLFIGNLEKDITGSELRKHFECFGEIIEIDIKKQGLNAYAFCQYSDIVSVVKAMRKMDGEHLGNNRIKLGFGKSMPTNCVWIDGIADSVSENYLSGQFSRYGVVSQVVIDRERKLALVSFEQIQYAQSAVKEMRGATLRGRKLQVDFASRECQEAFYDKLDKQASGSSGSSNPTECTNLIVDETTCHVVSVPGTRFGRYDSQSRSRTSSFSRHSNINSSGATSPSSVSGSVGASNISVSNTVVGGSSTPRGGRSRGLRHTDYEYSERRIRVYDEYSQGSAASHDDETYNYAGGVAREARSDSPQSRLGPSSGSTAVDTLDVNPSGRRRCEKSPGDIRNLQKERFHLLEQLEECPSSGDELVSPKKRMKFDHSSHHHNHHHTISSLAGVNNAQHHQTTSTQFQPAQQQSQQQQTHQLDCPNNSNSNSLPQANVIISDPNCDVINNHSNDSTIHHRKCVEVRRLSECSSLKYASQLNSSSSSNSRRPSIESGVMLNSLRHVSSSGTGNSSIEHSVNAAVYATPHSVSCKRRRTGNAVCSNVLPSATDANEYHSSRGRGHQLHSHHSHEASGGESADGSRPGTPLCDERPEVLPSEPRRIPREKSHEPMMLPLPKFGIQFFQQNRTTSLGATGTPSITTIASGTSSHIGQLYPISSSSSSSTNISHNSSTNNNNNNLSNSSNNVSNSVSISCSNNNLLNTNSSSALLNSGNSSHSSLRDTLSSPPLLIGTRLSSSSFHHPTQTQSTPSSSHYHNTSSSLPLTASSSYLVQSQQHHHHSRHHHHHHHGQPSQQHFHHSISMSSGSTEQAPSSPLRAHSLSSNSSDSEMVPMSTSPSIEERIKTLDEMLEIWSGGGSALNRSHSLNSDSLSHNSCSYTSRHKFLDLDVNEVKPSDIVKSVLAKKSIFDDDLQRLKNISDKYEPGDFSNLSRSSLISSTSPGIPNLAATKTPVVGGSSTNKQVSQTTIFQSPGVNQLQRMNSPMNSPQAMSPYNSPSPSPVITSALNSKQSLLIQQSMVTPQPAKGLQYPFPSHPPVNLNLAANVAPPTIGQQSTASAASTMNTVSPMTQQLPASQTSVQQSQTKLTTSEPFLSTKPKTNTITKSFSLQEKSPSSATAVLPSNSGIVPAPNLNRVLCKSASVPGSTNVGTVRTTSVIPTLPVSNNSNNINTVNNSNNSSLSNISNVSNSKYEEESESSNTGHNLRRGSADSSSSKNAYSSKSSNLNTSKKTEKSHKHNHRNDSEKSKSDKYRSESTDKRKSHEDHDDAEAHNRKEIDRYQHDEEKSRKDQNSRDQQRESATDRERERLKERERDKEKEQEKERDRLEKERMEHKKWLKQEKEKIAKRREKEEREKEEREAKERDEREKREREEKEKKQKELEIEKERQKKEKEEREQRERDARDRAEREEKERKEEKARKEREELERKQRQDIEIKEREEKARNEREEHERKVKEEHERKLREEQEQKRREELERKMKEEHERKLREEHERKLREEQERRQREEQERKLREELERKVREEQERKAREEHERKAREEQERKAREDEERKAKEEQERRNKEEQERKAREELERKIREENERQSTEEIERKAREEHDRKRSDAYEDSDVRKYDENSTPKSHYAVEEDKSLPESKSHISADSNTKDIDSAQHNDKSNSEERQDVYDRIRKTHEDDGRTEEKFSKDEEFFLQISSREDKDSKECSEKIFSSEDYIQKRRERNSGTVSPGRASKRRLSSQDSIENEESSNKRSKISGDSRKVIDRRDSKEPSRPSKHHKSHSRASSISKHNEESKNSSTTEERYRKDSGFEEKKCKDKEHKKEERERSDKSSTHKYKHKVSNKEDKDFQSSHVEEKEINDIRSSSEKTFDPNEVRSTDEEEELRHQHRISQQEQQHHHYRRNKKEHKEKKQRHEYDEEGSHRQPSGTEHRRSDSRKHESRHAERKSSVRSDDGPSKQRTKPPRKLTQSSNDSDSDEPKKHSIFDILDDGPYVSMYDKVKARSCKNMQKQEEEKKIKAKFTQLKQSRAKREEKKRSTSYDGDSDSDFDDRHTKFKHNNFKTARSCGFVNSSSDEGTMLRNKEHLISDSDSDARRMQYNRARLNELCDGDSSESGLVLAHTAPRKKISVKRNSRIASDSSDAENQQIRCDSSNREIQIKSETSDNEQSDKKELKVKTEIKTEDEETVEQDDISLKREPFDMLKEESLKNEVVPHTTAVKIEIKSEPQEMTANFFNIHTNSLRQEISESETNVCASSTAESKDNIFDHLFSQEVRKKHKKNKKRQKISSLASTDADNSATEHCDDIKTDKTPPRSLEHVFDELKRESITLPSSLTTNPQFSEKKKHKDRKEKKRDKSREEYDKVSLTKEEKHRLKKAKKSSKLESERYNPDNTSISQNFALSVKRGEKMEDIFGPISDEESQYSPSESAPKDPSRMFEPSSIYQPQPVVSAALMQFKQEPLTPKSHTVEENEENKQRSSSHSERERHRKEKREKKRKERERTREQHALSLLQQKVDDENSVDLDEAGRALEAQLMEDSDNKLTEETTPSTANTQKSDVADVFRFSEGDENSMEVVACERKEVQESHKIKEKKKKKKRSKEERHQRREHHHHNSSNHSSSNAILPSQNSNKLSIEITSDVAEEITESTICKPSPSLPCLLDESPPHKPVNTASDIPLSISPLVRDANTISPISKAPSLSALAKPVECKKKPDKFIPGFDVELDEKISESAVQSISAELTSPAVESIKEDSKLPIPSPPEMKNSEKMEEKSRVIISQEETEDAVAALLGESFGTSGAADYSFAEDSCGADAQVEEEDTNQVATEPVIPEEEAEEMRKAVQSLSNEEMDLKADTPQSEQDLQIDTDTEEHEEEPSNRDVISVKNAVEKEKNVENKKTEDEKMVADTSSNEDIKPAKIDEKQLESLHTTSVITKNLSDIVEKSKESLKEIEPKQPPHPVSDQTSEKGQTKAENDEKETTTTAATTPTTFAPVISVVSHSTTSTTAQHQTTSVQTTATSQLIYGSTQTRPTQPQTKVTVRSQSGTFTVQPPTISIPEQSHFIYPPINVMVSPRGLAPDHRISSPRVQSGQSISQQPSQIATIRSSSPHSPSIQRGGAPVSSQTSGIRQSAQLSPVISQHVVLQQRQLMSPPNSVQSQSSSNIVTSSSQGNIVLNRIPVKPVLASISKPIQPTNVALPQSNTAKSSVVHHIDSKETKTMGQQTITYSSVRISPTTTSSISTPSNNAAGRTTPTKLLTAATSCQNQQSLKLSDRHHSSGDNTIVQSVGTVHITSTGKPQTHQTIMLQTQHPINPTAQPQRLTQNIQQTIQSIPQQMQTAQSLGQQQSQQPIIQHHIIQQRQQQQKQIHPQQQQIQNKTPQQQRISHSQVVQMHQYQQQHQQQTLPPSNLSKENAQKANNSSSSVNVQSLTATKDVQTSTPVLQNRMQPNVVLVRQQATQISLSQQQIQSLTQSQGQHHVQTQSSLQFKTMPKSQSNESRTQVHLQPQLQNQIHQQSQTQVQVKSQSQSSSQTHISQGQMTPHTHAAHHSKVQSQNQGQSQCHSQSHVQTQTQPHMQSQIKVQTVAQNSPSNTSSTNLDIKSQRNQPQVNIDSQSHTHQNQSASFNKMPVQNHQQQQKHIDSLPQRQISPSISSASSSTVAVKLSSESPVQIAKTTTGLTCTTPASNLPQKKPLQIQAPPAQSEKQIQKDTVLPQKQVELTGDHDSTSSSRSKTIDPSSTPAIVTVDRKDETVSQQDSKVVAECKNQNEDTLEVEGNPTTSTETVESQLTPSKEAEGMRDDLDDKSERADKSIAEKGSEKPPVIKTTLTAKLEVKTNQKSLLTEENVTKLSPPPEEDEEEKTEIDSKEDSDYWSAKEVNIESVIKKVDALCSNDEIDDPPQIKSMVDEKPKEESDEHDKEASESKEKIMMKSESVEIILDKQEKNEDTNDEDEFDEGVAESAESVKHQRGGKRGRIGRGTKKISSSQIPGSPSLVGPVGDGIQTRRAKGGSHGIRGKRGRGGVTKTVHAIPTLGERKMRSQISDQDVYEFHEDSGEENISTKSSERPRLILTIKSPGQASTTVVQTKSVPVPNTMSTPSNASAPVTLPPAIGSELAAGQQQKEDFSAPAANIRKSRRLQEKDGGNRNTVDDTIEDVVRNLSTSPKTGEQTPPRRSTRNSQNNTAGGRGTISQSTDRTSQSASEVRKSPRANRRTKDRKASETSVDSSDEKVIISLRNDEKSTSKSLVDDSGEEFEADKNKTKDFDDPKSNANVPTNTMSSGKENDDKVLTAPKTGDATEPLTLIDPVTGLLTVVRQSKEGQYVPVPGANDGKATVGKGVINKQNPVTAPSANSVETLKNVNSLESQQTEGLVQQQPKANTSIESAAIASSSSNSSITHKQTSVVVTPAHHSTSAASTPALSSTSNSPSTLSVQQIQHQQSQHQTSTQQTTHIRTHPLKAHVLNSQLNKPVVTQTVTKLGPCALGQTASVSTGVASALSKQPVSIVQSNIVARQIQSSSPQVHQVAHSAQNVQQQQQTHLTVNVASTGSPHSAGSVNAAHSPRMQHSVGVKQQQLPQPPPTSQQPAQVLHVVTKGNGQHPHMHQQPQHPHQPIVIHTNKIQPPAQGAYTSVVQGTGKIVQQSSSPITISNAGKHAGVQMPVGIVQPQSHTHAQKPNASGVSVVTHQIGAKSVVGISGVQQHQNVGNPQLIHISQQQQQQSQVQQQQQQANQQTHIASIISNKQGSQQLHISSGQQQNMIAGNQHIMQHSHQSPHPNQPTGATILQAKAAHQQQVPSAKGVMGLHQTPQIMTAAVASPPLKQTHMASQQPVVTGASSLRASVPPISPQGQSRGHMLQPGLPVAAFEANMHEIGGFSATRSQSPPPAHQQTSPITPGEGTFSSRGVPREHFLMYHQQYLRAQEALGTRIPYITRSPLLPGTNDQKELAEIDESMVASPPLELRRPGSGPRTIPVSHNLQSPQDRATDSPQVAQVYVHGTRIPHPHYPDVAGRYYENVRAVPSEPPPAHRSAHSVVASPGSAYTQQTAPGTQLTHIHSKVLEREQREREKERIPGIPGHTSMPSHGSLVPAMPTPTGRNIQVATPPHASQVPPQADSLLMLLQRYPVMWQGLLALKTDQAAVQMHFVFGNPLVARGSLPCNSDGTTPPLRIAQRMRLEQTQLEGVAKKMQYENEHCMLLALPCGRDHMDVLQQSRNLQTGFITYLQQKMAAGIVNIPVPGSEQAAYVVHIFPSCDFANENLERAAPDLKHRVAEIAHLLIVIATV